MNFEKGRRKSIWRVPFGERQQFVNEHPFVSAIYAFNAAFDGHCKTVSQSPWSETARLSQPSRHAMWEQFLQYRGFFYAMQSDARFPPKKWIIIVVSLLKQPLPKPGAELAHQNGLARRAVLSALAAVPRFLPPDLQVRVGCAAHAPLRLLVFGGRGGWGGRRGEARCRRGLEIPGHSLEPAAAAARGGRGVGAACGGNAERARRMGGDGALHRVGVFGAFETR